MHYFSKKKYVKFSPLTDGEVVLIILPHPLRFIAKHFGKSRGTNKDSDVY